MNRFVPRYPIRANPFSSPPRSRPPHERCLPLSRSRHPVRQCLWVLALGVALAACNGDSDDAGNKPTPSSTTKMTVATTTTGATSPEASVLDAYRAYWAVVNGYGAEEKPFDPAEFMARFSPVATGAQYDSLFERFQLNRAQNLVYRGGEGDQLRPRIVELTGDRAAVEDCADDTGGIFSTRDHVFTSDTTPGQHSLIRAVLRLDAGTWKVSTQDGGDERCTP